MFKNVLIVCVGNVCRSPVAEELFRHHVRSRRTRFASAGLGALVGNPMDPLAQRVLREHGVAPGNHVARQVDTRMLHVADLILAMETSHIVRLRQQAPEIHGRVFLLGKWLNDMQIPDPFRQPRQVFEEVHELLEKSVRSWLPYLT